MPQDTNAAETTETSNETTEAVDTGNELEQTIEQATNVDPVTGKPGTPADKDVGEAHQELTGDDYNRLIPVKNPETGKVEKIPLKQFINRTYSVEGKLKKVTQATEAQLQNAVKQLVHHAKSNPEEFLQRIGVDPYEFSEASLKKKLALLEASPEQRRIQELEQENLRFKSEFEKTQTLQQKQEADRKQNEAALALDHEMTEAFTKSGLPRDKFLIQMAGALMLDSINKHQAELESNGYSDVEVLNATAALAKVKERFPQSVRTYLKALDPNQIREFLGKDILDKVRNDDIQRVQNQASATNTAKGTPPKAKKEPPVFTRDQDYRQWIDSLKR